MITKAVLNVLYTVVNALLMALPQLSSDFGISVVNGWNSFINVIDPILFLFPIGTLVLCITVIMGIHGMQLTWYIFNWSIRKIPGVQ